MIDAHNHSSFSEFNPTSAITVKEGGASGGLDPRKKLTSSDVRMLETCLKNISSPQVGKDQEMKQQASPTLISDVSTTVVPPEPKKLTTLEAFKHTLFQDADKLVNMKLLQEKVKRIANHQNMENIFKSAVHTFRDGLIEYMRVCIEELIQEGHASRQMNQLTNRNMIEGARTEYKCMDQRIYKQPPSEVKPLLFQTICVSNPKAEVESGLLKYQEAQREQQEYFEGLALQQIEKQKREEELATAQTCRNKKKGGAALKGGPQSPVSLDMSKSSIASSSILTETKALVREFSIQDTYMKNSNEALAIFTTSAQNRQKKSSGLLSKKPEQRQSSVPGLLTSSR